MENVNKQLLGALKVLFASYKQLADSGDAGNWRIEDYPEGQQALQAIAAAERAQQAEPVELSVWFGDMPETNGKKNWTAILHRKNGCISEGVTLTRSEYPDRARYEADRVRHLIGELKSEPDILAYDGDLHSGYVSKKDAQPPAVAVPDDWRDAAHAAVIGLGAVRTSIERGDTDKALSRVNEIRAMLAAAPQAAVAATLPPYDSFSDDFGESWRDDPADSDFVDGMKLGEEFELLGGWKAKHLTFRVTKVPDDESDDYEVEEVTAPAAAQKGGEA